MNITEGLIKNYTDEFTFKSGAECYKRGKVISMEVDSKANKYFMFTEYKIDAWVEATDFEEYNVNVVFNDKSGFMNFKCDCLGFYDSYKKKRICKHIVAVLLKYSKEYGSKNVKPAAATKTDKLIRDLKNSFIKSSNLKREVKLSIKYCYDRMNLLTSGLELKIGIERLYVVKNIKDFIEAYEAGKTLEFGKGFVFDSKEHKFSAEDRKLIEFIQESLDIEKMANYQINAAGQGLKLCEGKKLLLLDKQLNRFFAIIRGRTIEANIQGEEYLDVNVLEDNLPLSFNLRLQNTTIELQHLSEVPRPLSTNGRYFFYQNNIYLPSSEQLKVYIPFYNAFLNGRTTQLSFDKKEGDTLATYILPSLKKITDNVKIDQSIADEFYEEQLKCDIYLDKEGEGVSAIVMFNYGDIKIDAIKDTIEQNDKGILIRDLEKESDIVNFIESFGFEKENNKYLLKEEEKFVQFLKEGLDKLKEAAEVFYSEAFKNIKLYNSSSCKAAVRLNDENLLEFTFNMEGIDQNELKHIISAIREKKKYYKLKKGGFVVLEDNTMRSVGRIIDYLNIKEEELDKEKIILQKYEALYLDQSIKDYKLNFINSNEGFRELSYNIRNMKELEYILPDHLEGVLRDYQKVGYKWLKTLAHYGFGGILADEMGLGKTIQTIAFLDSERDKGIKKPSLVVAPTSLIYNWKSEIEKFSPDLSTLVIAGNKSQREELIKEIENCDVVVTSYPLLRRDIEDYSDICFKYCFIDEAQQIKNHLSMNSSAVKEIKAGNFFALTGTPLENSISELWSIFDFIMPGYLLSNSNFTRKYEIPIVKHSDNTALETLNMRVKPFILRRLKKDVIKELPPKIEQKLIVEMTEEQKKLYLAYLDLAKKEIEDTVKERGFGRSKIKIISLLTRLRQICCDPNVFIQDFNGESGKMEALDDLLEESIEGGHRVLLFSQFTSVLKNISNRLKNKNIEFMYLDGTTKVEERLELVKQFNEGKGSVFLISLKAGGTGLNLTGADVVVHFDPWWNPAVEDQATDRAHRIGQNKTVEVIKIIAKGSIEEKICKLQEKKKEMIQNIIGDNVNDVNLLSQMSEDEISDLFKI